MNSKSVEIPRNSRQKLGAAYARKGLSLHKWEILLPFNLHRNTERAIFYAAASSEHMCWLDSIAGYLAMSVASEPTPPKQTS